MSNELEAIKIYEFVRDEIKREDKNTHDRISSALAFQGILMAAMVFLISNGWAVATIGASKPDMEFVSHLKSVRLIVLFLVGLVGMIVAIASYKGVEAAQESINKTIKKWEAEKLKIHGIINFNSLPSAYADTRIHNKGKGFPYWINKAFMAFWALFLITITIAFHADFAGPVL